MGVQFIQMVQEDTHHLLLKVRHYPIKIIYDLFLCGLQIVCDDFLLIKNVILSRIHLFA